MSIRIKLLKEGAKLPQRATEGATGYDLFSVEDVRIPPFHRVAVSTGFVMEIPVGYDVQIRPRSGLALRNGVTVLNTPGTIDSDYRGEVKIILINLGNTEYEVKKGDRIAQMVVSRFEVVDVEFSEKLADTKRGDGGFGHTGL